MLSLSASIALWGTPEKTVEKGVLIVSAGS